MLFECSNNLGSVSSHLVWSRKCLLLMTCHEEERSNMSKKRLKEYLFLRTVRVERQLRETGA